MSGVVNKLKATVPMAIADKMNVPKEARLTKISFPRKLTSLDDHFATPYSGTESSLIRKSR